MVPIIVVFKSVLWVVAFTAFCLLIGRAAPREWIPSSRFGWLPRILIGFSLLVVILRIPYRNDLPLAVAAVVILLVSMYSLGWLMVDVARGGAAVLRQATELATRRRSLAIVVGCIMASSVAALIVYFPLLSTHAVYFQNHGPDLDGDLMSSSYLLDGFTWDRLMMSLREANGSFEWWDLANHPWTLPDFREGVAIEFFPRSLRWGHAVLTASICYISGEPVWFGFFVLTVFSIILIPLVLVDACLAQGIRLPAAVAMAIAVVGSQTFALMLYEGIVVQLIATPILSFLVLNYRSLLIEPSNLGQKAVLALLISALVSTFGEGVQILGVFAAIALMLYFATRKRLDFSIQVSPLVGTLIVVTLWIAVSPTVFFDFVLWSYARAQQAFIGGALYFDWSIFSLLIPMPYMKLGPDGLHLLVHASQSTRLLEATILLFFAALLLYRRNPVGLDVAIVTLTLTVFIATGHKYAIWKVAAVVQPLLVVAVFRLLPERIGFVAKGQLLAAFAGLALVGLAHMMWRYHLYSQPAHLEQFEVSRMGTVGQHFALITPSQSRIYLKLGSQGELFWANGGWRGPLWGPNFSIGNVSSLPIALYFDCDAEGRSRCAKIQQASIKPTQRTILLTTTSISTLLNPDGLVNQSALNEYILRVFGVEPRGGERPLD